MMKMRIRKAIALAMILVMVLSMSAAFAEKRTPSKPFKLPTVQQPATEAPAEDTETEAPAEEPEVPAETEAPAEEPEVPAATEAPVEEPEAPVETEAPETVIATAYVVLADANSTLNVRAAATTDSERLGSLAHGDQVSVVGYEGDWTKIVFGDGYGYVKSSFLSSEAPSTEPEVEPTEEPVVEPTEEPVVEPTEEPVVEPTEEPVVEPTEEPVEEFEAYTAYVSLQYESSSLNIRKSASEKAKVVGYLYHGDVVTVLGIEGEWTKVDANGVVGYVYSSFLTTTPPVVEEPEVEATEEPVVEPTEEPVVEATEEPVVEPTEEPEVEATEEPVVEPTEEPEEEEPVVEETEEPVVEPTEEPVVEATEEPVAEPTEEPEVEEPVVEATEEPTEEEVSYDFERDEDGNLLLDETGNPIPIVPEGMEIPVDYLRDEDGNLVLDENGNPIVTATVPEGAGLIDTIVDLLDPSRYIDLYAAWGDEELKFGTEATLIAVPHGYEKVVYTLQWQTSSDNENWTDVPGATESRCYVTVTEENYMDYWRVQILITDIAETAE